MEDYRNDYQRGMVIMLVYRDEDFFKRAFHKYIAQGYSADLSNALAKRDLVAYKNEWKQYSDEVKLARKGYKGKDQPDFDPLSMLKDKRGDPALKKYRDEIERLGLDSYRKVCDHYGIPYYKLNNLKKHSLEEIIDAWFRPRDKKGRLAF